MDENTPVEQRDERIEQITPYNKTLTEKFLHVSPQERERSIELQQLAIQGEQGKQHKKTSYDNLEKKAFGAFTTIAGIDFIFITQKYQEFLNAINASIQRNYELRVELIEKRHDILKNIEIIVERLKYEKMKLSNSPTIFMIERWFSGRKYDDILNSINTFLNDDETFKFFLATIIKPETTIEYMEELSKKIQKSIEFAYSLQNDGVLVSLAQQENITFIQQVFRFTMYDMMSFISVIMAIISIISFIASIRAKILKNKIKVVDDYDLRRMSNNLDLMIEFANKDIRDMRNNSIDPVRLFNSQSPALPRSPVVLPPRSASRSRSPDVLKPRSASRSQSPNGNKKQKPPATAKTISDAIKNFGQNMRKKKK